MWPADAAATTAVRLSQSRELTSIPSFRYSRTRFSSPSREAVDIALETPTPAEVGYSFRDDASDAAGVDGPAVDAMRELVAQNRALKRHEHILDGLPDGVLTVADAAGAEDDGTRWLSVYGGSFATRTQPPPISTGKSDITSAQGDSPKPHTPRVQFSIEHRSPAPPTVDDDGELTGPSLSTFSGPDSSHIGPYSSIGSVSSAGRRSEQTSSASTAGSSPS